MKKIQPLVAESVRNDRDESIRHRSQQLGLSCATTWYILRKDLNLKVHKIQLVRSSESSLFQSLGF